jgi:hypothetical protein
VYEAIGGAVDAFSNAAMSGQVYIEADAAADALSRIGKVKDLLVDVMRAGGTGLTNVQLGANPVGQAMARKSMSRYDGDDSYLAALRLLHAQTEKAETALKKCIDNYVDTDAGHASKFSRG